MKNYQTRDSALATTLSILGVPFAKDDAGQTIPFINVYDPGLLRQKGCKGMPILKAVQHCLDKGIPGAIHYQFERTPILDVVSAAWAKQTDELSAEAFGTAPAPTSVDLDPALVARVCCIFSATRKHIVSGWQTAIPYLVVPGESTVTNDPRTDGGKIISGSFKMISLRPWPTDERLAAIRL